MSTFVNNVKNSKIVNVFKEAFSGLKGFFGTEAIEENIENDETYEETIEKAIKEQISENPDEKNFWLKFLEIVRLQVKKWKKKAKDTFNYNNAFGTVSVKKEKSTEKSDDKAFEEAVKNIEIKDTEKEKIIDERQRDMRSEREKEIEKSRGRGRIR